MSDPREKIKRKVKQAKSTVAFNELNSERQNIGG